MGDEDKTSCGIVDESQFLPRFEAVGFFLADVIASEANT